ncbi:MAG: LysR family transcriptional regulator [Solirubrobacterales bacterium]|nr:LysR family transcriptional regulator [Solirubrobacterales bacterium]
MDVEMRHLRALLALAEELNFTRAAERLHLTQQALSGQIRQLEDRVGTQLVERDSHRPELSQAGKTLLEHARPLLAGAEHAILATRAAGTQPARLTVGYVAPLTRRLVAPAFERFYAAQPEAQVTIPFAGFLDPLGRQEPRSPRTLEDSRVVACPIPPPSHLAASGLVRL